MACAQSDAGITTSVKSQLAADDLVKARNINVDTRDRVVTLTGEVGSTAEEAQALQIARNTKGVANRDIAVRHVADSHMEDCTVGAHMTREDIETVSETDDAAKVLDAMKRREVRRIPVTNNHGDLVGVVAQADIAVTKEIPKAEVAEVVKSISEPAHPAR
jgi:CBS domain-containing protein